MFDGNGVHPGMDGGSGGAVGGDKKRGLGRKCDGGIYLYTLVLEMYS